MPKRFWLYPTIILLFLIICLVIILKKDICNKKFILYNAGVDSLTGKIFEEKRINANKKLKIDNEIFCVALANTNQKKYIGLGFVEHLDSNVGMLFVFNKPSEHSFWMKDVLINLDIVWLSSSKTIIHTKVNALPESYPDEVFTPNHKALYVLELNNGIIKDWSLVKKVDF